MGLIQSTMKSFAAAALVAVASAAPEAQPWLGYGGFGYGKRSADAYYGYGGYGGYAGLGYGHGGYPYAYATPALVAHPNGAVTPPYTPAQLAAAAEHFAARGKRSADAYYGGDLGGYGKRSADAYYGGYLGGYGKRSADAYYGGYLGGDGKRSADAFYGGYLGGYGYG